MNVKATTVYDWNAYIAKSGVYSYGRLNPKVGKAASVAVFAAIAVLFIWSIYSIKASGSEVNTTAPILVLILSVGHYIYRMFIWPRVRYNSMLKTHGQYTYHFVFSENDFKSELTPETEDGRITLDYANLAKVIETSDYIFLFINARNILPVDKSGIEGGRVEEVRNAIQAALGDKYKIARY